jgi:signal transduction histidine kinase
VATDPTTDPATPEESPSAPAAAGDVSLLADELLGSAEPAVSDTALWVDASDPEGGATTPRWVTLGEPGGPSHDEPMLSPRRVLVLLAAGVVGALLVVGVLGTLAARQLAEREATNDAATMARVLAQAVVEPSLTDGLLTGDPAAIEAFDQVAQEQLLKDDLIVRVKLWSDQGKVLYADERQLIGRTFPLSDEQLYALETPATVADVSNLDSKENAFENEDRALEVYSPVTTPGGQHALFEMYASYDPVGERTTQLWRGFAGVTASSLLLLVVIVAPLVWALVKRLRRAEEQHIELLQRAVDASADERRRIAASLHDGPVQELAATSFTVAGASATASAHGQGALARDLDAAAAAVRASIRSLRTLLVDIYPASLARSGIVAALLDLAQTTRRDDLVVRVDAADEDDLALSTDAQRLVHRIAQECLRNAAKHAGPATVIVSLHRDGPESVTLDVVDDGAGFDVAEVLGAAKEGHLGLHLLADAASVPGALLQVSTAPGRGTHWRLVLDGELGAAS